MKKTILLFSCASLLALGASAQTFVSTTPENRTVVLEEFTGIHCGYCPDGHARANAMVSANPGKVLLVNVHAGYYADPANSSEPDFRTTEGAKIDAAASISGYPAGSINRVKATTPQKTGGLAMSREHWATEAAKILIEPSPVNVAVKANIDPKTRKLTVDAEVYYTDNAKSLNNFITVMLLEDDIPGPQSDYGNFNPSNWVTIDGQKMYMHNHVLRMVLNSNGEKGEKLIFTSQGHTELRTYTKTLPAMINNRPLKFNNLVVVAIVHEAFGNGDGIISGAEAEVDYDTNVEADLALNNITAIPSNLCGTTLNPKAEVTNNSDADVTSFDVVANVNGTNFTKSYSGTLKKGEKTTIDWGNITLSKGGNYTLTVSGFSKINNDGLFDIDVTNDQSSRSGLAFAAGAMTTVNGSFENGIANDNFGFDFSQNDKFGAVYSTTAKIGANNTNGTVRFALHDSWKVSGKPGIIVFGELKIPANSRLIYHYAYSDKGNGTVDGSYGGTAPVIKVEISEDCGANWTAVGAATTAKETGKPAKAGEYYIPVSGEYIAVETNLEAYADKNALVRVSVTPGSTGNAVYVDEIGLRKLSSITDETSIASNMSLYPNPSNGAAYLQFSLDKLTPVSVDIYNVMGQKVQTVMSNQSLNSGDHKIAINASELAAGVYKVTMTSGEGVQTQSLNVVK